MDGRFPISKAKSSHYCEKKWETLWHFVKYMSCSLSVLTGCGVTGAVLRSSPSPHSPWEGAPEFGTFGLPSRCRTAACSTDVYLLLLQTELLLPISSASSHPSFGLPCLLVPVPASFCVLCRFPRHRLLSRSARPASPTYHGSSPAEPGNLTPAHPACSSPPQQRLQIPLENAFPKPSLSLPAPPVCFTLPPSRLPACTSVPFSPSLPWTAAEG